MANKVVKELQINVSIKNGKLVIDNVDQLKKSLLGIDTAQTRVAKSTADVANVNKNATKSFADQARASSNLVRSYAIVAANAFALSRAFEILKRNADLTIIEKSAEQLSRSTGTNFAKVAEDMKAITGGALNIKDAFTAANLGLSGGATVSQLEQITEVATKAANVLGRSVPEAVNRMIQAVIKGEPELVDEFGIILRVKEATDEYALSIGKVASELTTLERQQAIINQLIEQGTRKFSEVSIEVNPYQKLQTAFSELIDTLLKFISLPLGAVVGVLADNVGLLLAALATVGSFLTKQLVPSAKDFGATFNKSLKSIEVQAQKTFTGLGKDVNKFQKLAEKADLRRNRKSSKSALATADREIKAAVAASNSGILQKATQGLSGTRLIETVEDVLNPKALTGAEEVVRDSTGKITAVYREVNGEITKIFTKTSDSVQGSLGKLATGVAGSTKEASSAVRNASLNIARSLDGIRNAYLRTKQVAASTSIEMIKGISAVSNAATFGGAFTAFKDIGRNFEGVSTSAGRAGKAVDFVAKTASQAAGGIALLGRGLASIVSKFAFWGVVLMIAFEGLKFVADGLGLIDHEANAAEKVVDDLSNSFDELAKSSEQVVTNFNTASDSIEELEGKYTALNNKIGETSKAILDNVAALEKVSKRGGFSTFLKVASLGVFSSKDTKDTIDLIDKQIKLLENQIGEGITIPLVIDGQETTFEQIKNDIDLINRTDVELQIKTAFGDEVARIGKESLETTGAISDMAKAAKSLNDRSSEFITDFKNSLPSSQEVDDLLAVRRGLDVLGDSAQSNASQFISFTSGLNEFRRSSLGITSAQVQQAKGVVSLEKLLETLENKLIGVGAQQDAIRAFILKNKENDTLEETVNLMKELANTDFSKLDSFFDSDEQKKRNANLAGKTAALLSGQRDKVADGGLDPARERLDIIIAKTKDLETLEATIQARKVRAAKDLESARIQQSKGVLGSASKLFALENEVLRVNLDSLKAERTRLEISKAQVQENPDQVRNFDLALSSKEAEISATERLIRLKSEEFTREAGSIQNNIDLIKQKGKEQDIILANQLGNAKNLKAIEDNAFFTDERRLEAQKIRLILDKEVLNTRIKATELALKEAVAEEKLASERGNIGAELAAELTIAKEQAKLQDLRLSKEVQVTTQIEDRLKLIREEVDLIKQTTDLERNREELLRDIAGNKDVSAGVRQRALDASVKAQKEADRLSIQVADRNIELAKNNRDEIAKGVDSNALQQAEIDLRNVVLEKGVILNAQLDEQLEKRKAINELQKDLVDSGQGSFDKALAESLAIASEEFSRGLVSSVTIASNIILSSIDVAVDTLVDSLDGLFSGDMSFGDLLDNLHTAVTDTVSGIVEEQMKDVLKAFIKESLFGDSDTEKPNNLEQGKKSNDLLTNIDNNIARLVTKSGGTASTANVAATNTLGGVAGLFGSTGGLGGAISSFGTGLASLFSTEIEPQVKLASGGIVTSPTTALIGEAGPEAVIPLSGGSLPVQISETTSVAAVKALVTVGDQTQKQTDISGNILTELKSMHTDMNANFTTLSSAISSGVSSSRISEDADSGSNLIGNILAGVGLIGSVASAFSGSIAGGSSSGVSSLSSGVNPGSGAVGGLSGVGGSTGGFVISGAAKGAVFAKGIRALANGGITTSPELGLIGEGENNEAIVPLPDNRNIPVVLMNEDGEPAGRGGSPMINITMNVSGVGGTASNNNLNKSANQIALETARVVQRSLKRDD